MAGLLFQKQIGKLSTGRQDVAICNKREIEMSNHAANIKPSLWCLLKHQDQTKWYKYLSEMSDWIVRTGLDQL